MFWAAVALDAATGDLDKAFIKPGGRNEVFKILRGVILSLASALPVIFRCSVRRVTLRSLRNI
jgi:hypothetical protein